MEPNQLIPGNDQIFNLAILSIRAYAMCGRNKYVGTALVTALLVSVARSSHVRLKPTLLIARLCRWFICCRRLSSSIYPSVPPLSMLFSLELI